MRMGRKAPAQSTNCLKSFSYNLPCQQRWWWRAYVCVCVRACAGGWLGCGLRKRDNSEKTYCRKERKKCTMVSHPRRPNQPHSLTSTPRCLLCTKPAATTARHESDPPKKTFQHTDFCIYTAVSFKHARAALLCGGVPRHGPPLIKAKKPAECFKQH